MIPSKLFALGVGVAALGLSLALAAPANAAQTRALPEGETLYAIDCQDRIGLLASFDVTSAVGTAIGAGSTDSLVDCAADATYDATSGKIFWASWAGEDELFSMDPATGDSTYIGAMATAGGPDIERVGALMAGGDGVLYVVFNSFYSDANHTLLGTVDSTTAEVTYTHEILNDVTPLTDRDVWSGDYNPTDGAFYIINQEELFALDVTTGALTSHGLNSNGSWWYGLAFDSNGVMWTTCGRDCEPGSVSSSTVDGWSVAGNEESSDNETTIDSAYWFSGSNVIIPTSLPAANPVEPTLAATGVNGSRAGLIASGGTVVALLGAGVAMAARRRAATN